jgi:hypothetical protein
MRQRLVDFLMEVLASLVSDLLIRLMEWIGLPPWV